MTEEFSKVNGGYNERIEPSAKIIRAKGIHFGWQSESNLAQISAETKYLYSSSSTFQNLPSGKINSPSLGFDLLKTSLDPFFKTRLFLKF